MRKLVAHFSDTVLGQDVSDLFIADMLEHLEMIGPTLHPYGFIIFKFPNEYLNHQLRCHVWLSNYRNRQMPDWPPHSHNSPLHSFVMKGSVSNFVWEFLPSPSGKKEIYEVVYIRNKSFITKTGRRGEIRESSNICVPELVNYTIPRNVIHATEVPVGNCAVTLVLLSNKIKGTSKVVGEYDAARRYEFDRLNLESELASQAKRIVLRILTELSV